MPYLQSLKHWSVHILTPLTLLLLTLSSAIASTTNFPTNGWQTTPPEAQGLQSGMLADMLEQIRKQSLHIDSILVVRNGYLVIDAYFHPFTSEDRHVIHSCTKSIMSALIGIAIDQGSIRDVHQPVTDFFPDMNIAHLDDRKKSMTLEDLLTMTSGLDCRDSYRYVWTGLFELRASDDWTRHVLDLPMVATPGEKFEYCNGLSYLLSVIIQKTTAMRTIEFARKYLFTPLGIDDIVWDTSPQGVDIGWGSIRMKPRDMAKIGWLFMNKGRWGDRQILPARWVEMSTQAHVKARLFDQYGYQWWIDPAGYYMAVGFKGQRIFVLPEKNMVVIFAGDLTGRESLISKSLLERYIIPAGSSAEALPPNDEDQKRLATLVASAAQAPPDEIFWVSKEEGMARDGVFRRTVSPAFSFTYPFGSKKSGILQPGQIMRMKTLSDYDFTAFVHEIPEGISLEDYGPKFFAGELEKYGTEIKVLLNREVTLKCGSRAYRTDISWNANGFWPIKTFLVTAYKDDKVVFVCAHPWHSYYNAEPIVKSLRLK